jgi:glycosyltransferase involved in cell wall biosynthesis
MGSETKPIRILHVVAGMTRGGLETWLMNIMRRIDRDRFHFDFCTFTDRLCAYDEEIRSLGGRIIPCLWNRSVRRFNRIFREILRQGRYDVVHAHMYNFAGVILRAAARQGVGHRFAHLHTTGDGARTTLKRVIYRKLMVYLVRRHATRVLACSHGALDAFFGKDCHDDPRMRVVYCAADLTPFEEPVDRKTVRAELGVPADAMLMLHVGRFVEAKNHRYLIDIFHETRKRRSDLHLVLVGEGELLAESLSQVRELGLEECVHYLGVRSDVAKWMRAADVMVMPSIREGLPVTMIEAAAVGLPLIITDMPGTREAKGLGCGAVLLPLEAPVSQWLTAVLGALDEGRPDPDEALSRFRSSPFTSEHSARTMERVYAEHDENE